MNPSPSLSAPRKAIAYYRISTEKQLKDRPDQSQQKVKRKTGLGLEAQQEAVLRFAQRENYQIVADYTEVESGKQDDRPELTAALAQCKKERATLLIAKLDRLSRRVSFIASLMDTSADFRVVEIPDANKFQLHIMAAFSEYERDQISQRTKAALAAAKQRGTVLGRHGREVLSQQNAAAAVQFANDMRPIIEEIRSAGIKTIRAIKDELNRREIKSYRGNKGWCQTSVFNLLKRI